MLKMWQFSACGGEDLRPAQSYSDVTTPTQEQAGASSLCTTEDLFPRPSKETKSALETQRPQSVCLYSCHSEIE